MNLSFKQSHKYLWKTSVFITSIVLSLSLLFSTDLSSVDALSKVGSRGEEVVKIQKAYIHAQATYSSCSVNDILSRQPLYV